MININNINIKAFRNIGNIEIDFVNMVNIFHGNNGHGKTNILEAIFVVGTMKSFRHASIKEMIKWNESVSTLKCVMSESSLKHDLYISFNNEGKQLKVDGKNVHRAVDYCNYLSVVAFSPEEMRMVNGSPELRRRYLDRAIFSSNSEYLGIYHDYHRALKQRNHLLRSQKYIGIEAWTEHLASAGARLVAARKKYVTELADLFSKFYMDISGSDEVGRLCYHANSLEDLNDQDKIKEQLYKLWTENSRLERERGVTLKGPHRDDLVFILHDKPIREHGSQGQQKSFVIALKMAEIENLKRTKGRHPVLLLDDMASELDGNRTLHMMNFLADRQIQVFITATDHKMVPLAKEQEFSSFHVENGRIV